MHVQTKIANVHNVFPPVHSQDTYMYILPYCNLYNITHTSPDWWQKIEYTHIIILLHYTAETVKFWPSKSVGFIVRLPLPWFWPRRRHTLHAGLAFKLLKCIVASCQPTQKHHGTLYTKRKEIKKMRGKEKKNCIKRVLQASAYCLQYGCYGDGGKESLF